MDAPPTTMQLPSNPLLLQDPESLEALPWQAQHDWVPLASMPPWASYLIAVTFFNWSVSHQVKLLGIACAKSIVWQR